MSGPAVGEAGGLVSWLAPELFGLRGASRVGIRSDIYALGVTLWEVCTGLVPYADVAPTIPGFRDQIGVLLRGGHGEEPLRPALEQLPADTPPAVAALMQRMWAGEPAERGSLEEAVTVVQAAVAAVEVGGN